MWQSALSLTEHNFQLIPRAAFSRIIDFWYEPDLSRGPTLARDPWGAEQDGGLGHSVWLWATTGKGFHLDSLVILVCLFAQLELSRLKASGRQMSDRNGRTTCMVHVVCSVALVVLFSLRSTYSCCCFWFECISPGPAPSIRNWEEGLHKAISGWVIIVTQRQSESVDFESPRSPVKTYYSKNVHWTVWTFHRHSFMA